MLAQFVTGTLLLILQTEPLFEVFSALDLIIKTLKVLYLASLRLSCLLHQQVRLKELS
jgi:hypothetical protein